MSVTQYSSLILAGWALGSSSIRFGEWEPVLFGPWVYLHHHDHSIHYTSVLARVFITSADRVWLGHSVYLVVLYLFHGSGHTR